mgnify:CR=1 FL=1|jgi:hypothetical protein
MGDGVRAEGAVPTPLGERTAGSRLPGLIPRGTGAARATPPVHLTAVRRR